MFEVPQIVFDTYKHAADAMIDSNFGVRCQLIYPEEQTICINCIFNSATSQSTGVYNGTGPISFQNTICPYCNGVGYTPSVATEDIILRCYFNKKSWLKVDINVKIPDGAVQTIGHIADLPKCRRCNYLVANIDMAGYVNDRYRLIGEPALHGFKKKDYFIAFWGRQE